MRDFIIESYRYNHINILVYNNCYEVFKSHYCIDCYINSGNREYVDRCYQAFKLYYNNASDMESLTKLFKTLKSKDRILVGRYSDDGKVEELLKLIETMFPMASKDVENSTWTSYVVAISNEDDK